MNYKEYGKENSEVIILLHGGGLSWWSCREAAEKLASCCRVILPILDGHANSGCDFISIEENAKRIIRFIDEHFNGSVLMMGGLSLGGQILLEILSERNDICRYALIESALTVPSKIMHALIKPIFGSCYGLIHKRWFAKMQFKSLRINNALFEEYFNDTRAISKKNMIAFLEADSAYSLKAGLSDCHAKAYIFAGEKEQRKIRRSAKMIHDALSESVLEVLPDMHHGEFSINHAADYADTVKKLMANG